MRNPLTRVVGSYETFPWWMGVAWRMNHMIASRAVVLPFHIPARFFRWAWWWLKHPARKIARFEREGFLQRQIDSLENRRKADRIFNEQDVKASHRAGWRAGYANAYEVMGAMVDGNSKTEGAMLEAGRAALKRPE